MTSLSNSWRANIIRDAYRAASSSETPVFNVREALSEALYGSGLDWNSVAAITFPNPALFGPSEIEVLEFLATKIEQAESESLSDLMQLLRVYTLIARS